MIDTVALGGTEVSDTDPAMPSSPPGDPASDPEPDGGFSAAEKLIGVDAANKAPLTSSAAATFMLRYETNPQRREQSERHRGGALVWLGVGLVAAIIAAVVIIAVASSHAMGASCRGGINRYEPPTKYQSTGNGPWTATYPCRNGGSKTVRVPAKQVPGGG